MRCLPWLSAAILAACAAQPTSPSSALAPQTKAVPVDATPMPDGSSPSIPSKAGVPWGLDGHMVADASPLSLHTRVRLQEDPDSGEPIAEVGRPIPIIYEKENTGAKPLTVWHAGFWPNHRVLLFDSEGHPVPPTSRGKQLAAAFSPRGMRGKNVEWQLKPDLVDASEGAYDLATLFQIVPGHYTLRIDYEEDLLVVSNSLPLWILPQGARMSLARLNDWDAEECDLAERPSAYPDRVAAGEPQGFITSHKDELRKLGVIVAWDQVTRRYRIQSLER